MNGNLDGSFAREQEIYLEALERSRPGERQAYLDRACGDDAALRARIEALLRHPTDDGFLEEPALVGGGAERAVEEGIGTVIGRYRLREKIGEGGCGVVYLAEQEEPVRRQVALKVIKLGMDTKRVIARFQAERQALALMDHPNIARVLDAGATETGRPYFVMELVRGARITECCDQHQLSTEERLDLFIQVCRAVQHAHQKGIIHRDLKPSNIMVTLQDGVLAPKVIDFGIAKAIEGRLTDQTVSTELHQFIGTPAYISPEQAGLEGADVDTRSDIYSLGVLLYELLTGKTPFDTQELLRAGLDEMRRTIREREPSRPSTRLSTMLAGELKDAAARRASIPPKLIQMVRGDLDWIVMKCLEKDPARRYATANGLAADLERHLRHEPVVARPPSKVYRLQKLVQRHKWTCGAAGAVAVTLVLGIMASTEEAVRAKRAEAAQSRLRSEAVVARQQAEAAQRQAETEARRAEAAATEARRTLAASDFSEATRLIESGDDASAVAYLSRVLAAAPEDGAALTRLATLITYHSWMIPAFSLKHQSWVKCAAFSPDGKRVVTASNDLTARVWDALTGEPVTHPLKHGGEVSSARFSPDGKRVVTASWDGTAQVWNAQTGQPVTGPLKHEKPVRWAEFSPDGRRVVTASEDHTARVWDAQTGRPLTGPLQQQGSVEYAQFSPDGQRIVTASFDPWGSQDPTARVWDAHTGQPLTGPLKHGDGVCCAQFSPDGRRIVTASWDNTARVWDAQTGQPLTEALKHVKRVHWAQFSPDARRIVTASEDNTARVWDALTGRPLTEPLQHRAPLSYVQFSPDGRRIITASWDHTARVWDAETGQPLSAALEHGGAVWSAQFSPDGQRVVTASADNTACEWHAATGPPLAAALTHPGPLVLAQFSPDGRRVVTASRDSTARVWDAQTGQPVTDPLSHQQPVNSAQFSPDGKRVVTASQDSTARVWDAQTGKPLTGPLSHYKPVYWAQFSPDGKRIVTVAETGPWDGAVWIWDAQTGQAVTGPLKKGGAPASAQFSPDGQRVVAAHWDNTARVWDAQTGRLLIESLNHTEPVAWAEFSRDGRRVLTASADRTARVWDAQTGRPLGEPMKHADYVLLAHFSPDGQRVVTASRGSTARVWDAQTGQPLTGPLKHERSVNCAQFSPDGGRVVTASDDHTARVWDAQTGRPLTEPLQHGGPLRFAQFSPDGRRVVTACRDGAARVWDVGLGPARCPDWLLRLAEALSGNRLNKQGLLEPTTLDRSETIAQIRRQLADLPDDGDGVMWGRWVLADRSTRAISPFSSLTVPAYIANRIEQGTAQSLDEAEQLACGNAELLRRVAEARALLAPAQRPGSRAAEPTAPAEQGELAPGRIDEAKNPILDRSSGVAAPPPPPPLSARPGPKYVGNSLVAANGGADSSPPLVILGEYSPAGPLGTASSSLTLVAGEVKDVKFYGQDYSFSLYALRFVTNGPNPSEQTFRVVAAQSFSGTNATPGVQTLPVSGFFLEGGELLAFVGTGPHYPQKPNDAPHSDATFEDSSHPGSFVATPLGGPGRVFTVGPNPDRAANYQYVSDLFGNQGRAYAVGVDVSPRVTPASGR